MVRRTKEDALVTRHNLLDAAELLFQAQGVSRTSLNDIAKEAGTTRGAIYWHFKDKADLFNAMMERVTLPLEQSFETADREKPGQDPLERIREVLKSGFKLIATDDRTRRVFEVVTQKVEYIDELQAVRARHLTCRNEFLGRIEDGLKLAVASQGLSLPVSAATAAQGLHALLDGLLQNWLLDTEGFDLAWTGEQVMDVYLRGLGLKLDLPTQPATAKA
ncbi:MAG: TetR family transcriptional regulator [Pseudomonadota bacterium]